MLQALNRIIIMYACISLQNMLLERKLAALERREYKVVPLSLSWLELHRPLLALKGEEQIR